MRKLTPIATAAVTVVWLTGCTTAPLSFLDGRPLALLAMGDLYPVRIVSVDGQILFSNPVNVDPGVRFIVLEAAPGDGARGTVQRSFAFKVEPCTRYYLGAVRKSRMRAEWELVTHSTERVSGCDPDEELKKAKRSGAS